jgi:6,7-dimethyl-8-ribityllumazine synthase
MAQVIEGRLSAEGHSYGIVVSRFNSLVTKQLLDGAIDCLIRHGASDKNITVAYCPGSYEIPQVTHQLASAGNVDAVICLGCIIRGETPHYDYIASEAARGINQVAMLTGVPVSFGVLTTETLEQALERAGAKAGNKGWDAAMTAMELVHVARQLSAGKKGLKQRS